MPRHKILPVPGLLVSISVLVIVGAWLLSAVKADKPSTERVEAGAAVYFAPGDSPTTVVVRQLAAARRTVHLQAYSFTSSPIAKALVGAKRRGVDVTAILDKSNRTARYSSADFLAHEGVPTYIDAKHAKAHNKIIIIDGQTVVTGSFNFTRVAEEKNSENLLVIRDEKLAQKYEQNWQIHFAHSEQYVGK